MNDQGSFFDDDGAPIPSSAYGGLPPHEKSSETSREAARSMVGVAGTCRRTVYDFIAARGALGATDSEVERGLEMLHQTASARRRELELCGALRKTILKRPTTTGRNAAVYVARALP